MSNIPKSWDIYQPLLMFSLEKKPPCFATWRRAKMLIKIQAQTTVLRHREGPLGRAIGIVDLERWR